MPHLLKEVYTKVQTLMENEFSGISIGLLVKGGIIEA